MIEKIAIFYLLVFALLVALKRMRPNLLTSLAFSWFGPFPEEGELLSSYKARRVMYALNWTIQFVACFAFLTLARIYFKGPFNETFFLVAGFAGTIGLGMAVLAFAGFSISWLKTVIFGPDPKCEYIEEHEV